MARSLWSILMISLVKCSDVLSPVDLVLEYTRTHHPLQRPVTDPNCIINVTVSLNILHIQDLDETKQQLTSTGWFYFVWAVEGLSWSETKFKNISRVHMFPKNIYLPDLVIVNEVTNYGQVGSGDLPVTIWSNGTVEWYAAVVLTTSCRVDVTRFPFDHQRCFINLSQWFTFSSEVQYTLDKSPVTFTGFKENGEWEIEDFSAQLEYAYNGTYQVLAFEIMLGRRHAYYILTAVLPACVLSVLNLLVFHVPPGSGEKLTLCVSILLSYAVYLTSISSLLPSVSDHVALFSVYLSCMFIVKALTVAASVYVLYLQFAHHENIPFAVLAVWMLPCERKRLLLPGISTEPHASPNDAEITNLPDLETIRKKLIKRTDRILFYVFLSTTVACTVGFFAVCVI